MGLRCPEGNGFPFARFCVGAHALYGEDIVRARRQTGPGQFKDGRTVGGSSDAFCTGYGLTGRGPHTVAEAGGVDTMNGKSHFMRRASGDFHLYRRCCGHSRRCLLPTTGCREKERGNQISEVFHLLQLEYAQAAALH